MSNDILKKTIGPNTVSGRLRWQIAGGPSANRLFLIIIVLTNALAGFSIAQLRVPDPPQIVQASDEGAKAIAQFSYPGNIRCELFAAEPDVANIVALHRDFEGNLFVCETFRQEFGVEDNRRHADWMDDELRAQTVQDRINYIRKYIPDADETYTAYDDRIRLLLDTNGDGKADKSTVYSDRYNQLEMGTGAGVLSYRDLVYYTCIPDLFVLKDQNADGVADRRDSLHTGFGVHFAFRGHDMHGLIVGPDGRLYFSIGDRGYNVSPDVKDASSGAVFRCELDGSHLEVICTGLRNPQELAFDDFGNLFTGDNNSDSGDKARWVYLVPGSDSGWRMYYQYLEDRGPFNREKIWHPYCEETPAYIVPPVANISDGPSGLEYYPGTGFGDNFEGRFFLCDFRGNAANSGIRSFRSRQQGAFWKLEDDEQPFWNLLATDLDFGSDGKLYVSDWVFGWQGENKGRIYSFFDEQEIDSPIVKQVETLLREGLDRKDTRELRSLLAHQDQRVRQEAQFELVSRNDVASLTIVAMDGVDRLARVHAIWGLGQLARRRASSPDVDFGSTAKMIKLVGQLIQDPDHEIRAQATQLVADAKLPMENEILPLLRDPNLRVRFYTSMALAKIGTPACIGPISKMLSENRDQDPIVRHGGIMALSGQLTGDGLSLGAVKSLSGHESKSVRIALCIAIRKALTGHDVGSLADGLEQILGSLLSDTDPSVVVEAVRAIHDLPLHDLMPQLANFHSANSSGIADGIHGDAIVRRVINANFRSGQPENAIALAEFAANPKNSEARRVDALTAIANWMAPPERDAVLNDWRPIDVSLRRIEDAQNPLLAQFSNYTEASESIASAAIAAAGTLNVTGIGANLESVVASDSFSDSTRSAALTSLRQINDQRLPTMLRELQAQFSSLPAQLAATVADAIAESDSELALKLVEKILERSETEQTIAKQMGIATVGRMSDSSSADWIVDSIEKVSTANFPESLRLDVVLAAENRSEAHVKERLAEYRRELASDEDPSMIYTDTLFGGSEESGRQVFFGKTEVSCVRCHRIDGTGGNVGPNLSGLGLARDRKYILDSLVNPNKVITDGYAQVKVQTIDGLIYIGIVQNESDTQLQLLDADGKKVLIPQEDVDGVKPGLSAMPDDLIKQMSHNEIRDLVEYLASRKSPVEPVVQEGEHESP